MLSAQNCRADNDFHCGLVGGISVAASSPRPCREAFPAGHLTPLIGLRVCQGGRCRGVIDIGLESVVVDRAKEALCRLRRTRES